ncbi:MAG: cytochrome c5 family protein, partial [Hyphomonas sp.]|nr:cytochrome c5 family protein [Hyphomonas sp.]
MKIRGLMMAASLVALTATGCAHPVAETELAPETAAPEASMPETAAPEAAAPV